MGVGLFGVAGVVRNNFNGGVLRRGLFPRFYVPYAWTLSPYTPAPSRGAPRSSVLRLCSMTTARCWAAPLMVWVR